MVSKKINPLVLAIVIALSIIVIYFITDGSLRGINSLSERNESNAKNELINPITKMIS
jgi:uncharacterized protein (UPF0333 family)